MILPKKTLLALLPFFLQVQESTSQATSGSGKTTRYWDCCKSSCSWTKKISLAAGATPVQSCDINDSPLANFDAKSGCDGGGPAYMCSDQTPWAIDDNLSYGFAAASISGGTESSWCCGCYELTFTSGPVIGKKFVVQVTNTGGDLGSNHFDLAIPGGGFGIFNGCTNQWGTPSTGWGAQYGGVSSRSQCDNFNPKLKAGCYWRFDWFKNADNPDMTFKKVTCPAELTNKTGCIRAGEVPAPVSSRTTTKPITTTPVIQSTTTPVAPTTTAVVQTTTTPVIVTSPTTSSRTTLVVTSTAGPGINAPKWGQCGGLGWTGPTVCVSGSTCTVTNQWYSQCL